jgi:hypothetical protein
VSRFQLSCYPPRLAGRFHSLVGAIPREEPQSHQMPNKSWMGGVGTGARPLQNAGFPENETALPRLVLMALIRLSPTATGKIMSLGCGCSKLMYLWFWRMMQWPIIMNTKLTISIGRALGCFDRPPTSGTETDAAHKRLRKSLFFGRQDVGGDRVFLADGCGWAGCGSEEIPGFARKLGDAGFLGVVAGKIARLLVFAGCD